MVAFTTIPADTIPVDKAYWIAARELFPFINFARPMPIEGDKESKQRGERERKEREGREHKWRKAYERTRRVLAQLDKRWRLSLAGLDPMTGKRLDVALPTFIVHPETHARQAIKESVRWLDPNEFVRAPCFVHVRTAAGGKPVECPVLVDQKDFERWLDRARTAFKVSPAPPRMPSRKGPAPGTLDRFGKSDRALFPEIERIMSEHHKSIHAAALELARDKKVDGVGTPESRAKRLAQRFLQERRSTATR